MSSLPLEVRRVTREVLLALAGEDAGDAMTSDSVAPTATRLACCVRISGADERGFKGQVIVHASVGLALIVAKRMFGEMPKALFAPESQAGMREIANIVAGNIAPLLGDGLHVDLPVDLPLDAPYPDLESIAETIVDHYGQKLEVRVFAEIEPTTLH